MSRMHNLKTASNGEPTVWWSWQDLRGGVERKGLPPKGICTHGRAWLRSLHNGVTVEWVLFSRSCHASVTFSSTGDDAISLALSIPFLFAIYLSLEKAQWVKRLPGVRWKNGDYDSGEREIRVAIHNSAVWWTLWVNGNGMRSSHWRDGCFHFDDFLLGREKYSEGESSFHGAAVEMPEGYYPASVRLFTSTWKRSRWPWAKSIRRAEIEVGGGIPIPGDGENDWDLDDDAILGGTYPVDTVDGALAAIRESAMRDRLRTGGENWQPGAGWPAHCEAK